MCIALLFIIFFFNDTATTEIYTLSLHDALPISRVRLRRRGPAARHGAGCVRRSRRAPTPRRPGYLHRSPIRRSEEHTSELQSLAYLVCRLLLEKKKKEDIASFCLCRLGLLDVTE